MFSRLVQVPLLRAVAQPKRFRADLGVAATADPAAHRPGEQIARPPPVPERRRRRLRALRSRASGLPRLHAHPRARRRRSAAPGPPAMTCCRGVEPRDPLAGRRVLHVAQAVPDQPADIELVVEDAGAARGIAVRWWCAPGAAPRAGNASGVERRAIALAIAGGELAKIRRTIAASAASIPPAAHRLAAAASSSARRRSRSRGRRPTGPARPGPPGRAGSSAPGP